MPPNSEGSGLPFLSDNGTINYVQSSKLMVLISSEENAVLKRISETYGSKASCITENDESKQIAEAQTSCAADQHVVGIIVGNLQSTPLPNLKPYTELAYEHNYHVVLVGENKTVIPDYVGWHLNEADSCMMGCCALALLEDLLKTFHVFYSDFRDFSEAETLKEMLKYYQLASSNHNGMLHCTAMYFGTSPPTSSQEYFERVKENITMSFETTVIGIVITPRTFGARLKLSAEQLKLWGGDDGNKLSVPSTGGERLPKSDKKEDAVSSLTTAMAQNSITTSEDLPSEGTCHPRCTEGSFPKKRSPRYFPNCQASLVYSTAEAEDQPDFHPVSGPGRKAHMTLGVAPGVSAVTTGYDLLEIVELEKQDTEWPTYPGPRGWLRNYGAGRWVLYMKSKITVGSLFAGVYDFS